MAACQIDESSLPILTGCPGSGELIVVGNAVGGIDPNGGYTIGYARRYLTSVYSCILQSLVFVYRQLAVPTNLSIGATVIRIDQNNVITDSVMVVLDAGVLDRNDNTQVSYAINYDDSDYPNPGFTITLNQGAQNLQTYVITFAHS